MRRCSRNVLVACAMMAALGGLGGRAEAGLIPVLSNNDIKAIMHNLGWGDATVNSVVDQGALGVDVNITWKSFTSGESKLSWGTNNTTETKNLSVSPGSNNWSVFDQYAIEVTWLSSTNPSGTVQGEVFMNDNSWGWHQPPRGGWPVLDYVGDKEIIYWDLTKETFARTNVPRVGFQFITKDLPGETVTLRVKGSSDVPEPASMSLVALGLLGLVRRRRKA